MLVDYKFYLDCQSDIEITFSISIFIHFLLIVVVQCSYLGLHLLTCAIIYKFHKVFDALTKKKGKPFDVCCASFSCPVWQVLGTTVYVIMIIEILSFRTTVCVPK